MKKKIGIILLSVMLCFALAACGEKPIDKTKKAMEGLGYKVTTTTLDSNGVLVASKGSDTVTATYCSSEEAAIELKKITDATAIVTQAVVRIDGRIVYAGTSAAVKDFEKAYK